MKKETKKNILCAAYGWASLSMGVLVMLIANNNNLQIFVTAGALLLSGYSFSQIHLPKRKR